jgi:rare lipoprotein A
MNHANIAKRSAMRPQLRTWVTLLLMATLVRCGEVHAAKTGHAGRGEVGLATYYSNEFAGRKTASGEKYDPKKFTAAHRTLPFGTRVKVTRLDNGKSVVVRINDRGPFTKGRIIDLSLAAAKKIDMIRSGVVKVRVEIVEENRKKEEQESNE